MAQRERKISVAIFHNFRRRRKFAYRLATNIADLHLSPESCGSGRLVLRSRSHSVDFIEMLECVVRVLIVAIDRAWDEPNQSAARFAAVRR